MKITVRTANRTFEVEVGDVRERPVIATIDGERFEVWPETGTAAAAVADAPGTTRPAGAQPAPRLSRRTTIGPAAKTIRAPIPGVILSVTVTPGATVTRGQTVCVLEAMKMKNPIHAPRAGQIATVHVAAGQAVKHDDVLMEFAE